GKQPHQHCPAQRTLTVQCSIDIEHDCLECAAIPNHYYKRPPQDRDRSSGAFGLDLLATGANSVKTQDSLTWTKGCVAGDFDVQNLLICTFSKRSYGRSLANLIVSAVRKSNCRPLGKS